LAAADTYHAARVDIRPFDFRMALSILERRAPWIDLLEQIAAVTDAEITREQAAIARKRVTAPAGAQTALNAILRRRLAAPLWQHEAVLFSGADNEDQLGEWRMDFARDRVGIEVSFNHSEAIPWTLTRLNLAGESTEVLAASRIDVGVALYPTKRMKEWGHMDAAVGTYERACLWLTKMRPVMPIPIAVVGIDPATDGTRWIGSAVFRGTIKHTKR